MTDRIDEIRKRLEATNRSVVKYLAPGTLCKHLNKANADRDYLLRLVEELETLVWWHSQREPNESHRQTRKLIAAARKRAEG